MEHPSQIENLPQIKNLTLQDFTSVLGNLSLGVQDEFKRKICKKICDKLWVVETREKSVYFRAESKRELIRKISVSNKFRESMSFLNQYGESEVYAVVYVCVVCGVNSKHSHNINELNGAHWLEITEDLYYSTNLFKKVAKLSDEMMSLSETKIDSLASLCLTFILKNVSPGVQDEFEDKLYCKLHKKLWKVFSAGTENFIIAESKEDVILKMSVCDEFRELFLLDEKVETWTHCGYLGYLCVVCDDYLPEEEAKDINHFHNISEMTDTHWFELAKILYIRETEFHIEKVEIIE